VGRRCRASHALLRQVLRSPVVEASLKTLAVALALIALGYREAPAETLLLAMAAASLAAGLASVLISAAPWPNRKGLSAVAKLAVNAQLSGFNRYAAGIALLQTVGGYVEVFLVQWQCGSAETATFFGAQRLALALPLLGGVLATVLLPRAAVLETPAACAAYVKKVLLAAFPWR